MKLLLKSALICGFLAGVAQAAIEINWTIGGAAVMDGSTSDAPIPVPQGALIQLIWAGADDAVNFPDVTAGPDFVSGDDVVLASTNFINAGGFTQPNIQREYPLPGSTAQDSTFVFARIYDVADPTGGGCNYYDTPLLSAQEQTGSDNINADVLDMTNPADFITSENAGSVPVVVTDTVCPAINGGCENLSATFVRTPTCVGGGSMSVTATGVGGTGPYAYQWDAAAGNQSTATATGLAPGTYEVQVTDLGVADCSINVPVTVGEAFCFMVGTTATPCPSATAGTATVTDISGAVGTVVFTWNVPAGATVDGGTASDLPAGDFSVVGVNGDGQTVTQEFTIASQSADIDFMVTKVDPQCGDPLGGSASVSGITGGAGGYTVQWDAATGNQTGETATGLGGGTYMVTVSDGTCSTTRSVTLVQEGEGPTINCTPTATVMDCPIDAAGYDPVAAQLATDSDGVALAPVGQQVETDELPCRLVVAYTFTLTNECAVSTCVARVTFLSEGPTLADPLPAALQDQQLTCAAPLPMPETNAFAGALTGCGEVTVSLDFDLPSGNCRDPNTPAHYIFTATDTCGAQLVFTQTYTWAADTTPPSIQPIAQVDLDGCATPPAPDADIVQASDQCNPALTVTLADQSETMTQNGRTRLVRTWDVADACGNADQVEEVITYVSGSTPPVFDNLPQTYGIEQDCDSFSGYIVPDLLANPPAQIQAITLSGGVDGLVTGQNPPAGTPLTAVGVHRIFLSATNSCGLGTSSYVDVNLSCDDSVPAGMTGGSISGIKWHDRNANGRRDPNPGEVPIPGIDIYLDLNNNGINDAGDRVAVTDADGVYVFSNLPSGVYRVREDLTAGYANTYPLGGSHVINLQSGAHLTGFNFGNQGQLMFEGVVFNDLDGDGSPDNNDLSQVGIDGVQVTVYLMDGDNQTAVGTDTSGPAGGFRFNNLSPDFQYAVGIDESSLPQDAEYELSGPAQQEFSFAAGGGDFTPSPASAGSFSVMPAPTAIALERLDAVGDTVTWVTAWEHGTLGFFVDRLVEGERTRVNDTLILADGSSGSYSVVDPDPPAAGVQARYILVEVEADLDIEEYGPAILVHAASPTEGELATHQAAAGAVRLDTDDEHDRYLVIGLPADAVLEDVTDPADPIPLQGETLTTDSGSGRYFSWPAGRTIQSR